MADRDVVLFRSQGKKESGKLVPSLNEKEGAREPKCATSSRAQRKRGSVGTKEGD
jgi:hypothetical protein